MAKGSQLSQLKSALNHAGVVDSNSKSKKRKRSAPTEKDKEKRATKLDEIQRRLNPFDTKVTKLKRDVGGRKLKGVTGKLAQSKMAGIEQRKKTLLKEVKERGRAGGILDRRFGENDPSSRYVSSTSKSYMENVFNSNNDSNDTEVITP